jgi:branched-chain amino acid transport system ATP-binding protein
VPQTGGVFPAMTVQENLKLAGYTLRRQPEKLEQRVESVIDLFPILHGLLEQRAGQLSGGQQRMLSLAMALVPGYRLLLLDEPSIGLSPVMVESTLKTVNDLTRRLGLTTLLCEQNVRPALEVADRAYVLKAGQVAHEADAAELRNDRDLWRLF